MSRFYAQIARGSEARLLPPAEVARLIRDTHPGEFAKIQTGTDEGSGIDNLIPTSVGGFLQRLLLRGATQFGTKIFGVALLAYGIDKLVSWVKIFVSQVLVRSVYEHNSNRLSVALLMFLELSHEPEYKEWPSSARPVIFWTSRSRKRTGPRSSDEPFAGLHYRHAIRNDTKDRGSDVRQFEDYAMADILFQFEGTYFMLSRSPGSDYASPEDYGFLLRWIGLSDTPLVEIQRAAMNFIALVDKRKPSTMVQYRCSDPNFRNNFRNSVDIPYRSWSTLFYSGSVEEKVRKDVIRFRESHALYLRTGMPYRRSHLWYGPPGCGKSSAVIALASEFRMPIYRITSECLGYVEDLIQSTNPPAILLLEDADVIFPTRADPNLTVESSQTTPVNSELGPPKRDVNFSDLLNALDGVGSKQGLLVIMTTNCPEKLDPTVTRKGRVDKKFEFTFADRLSVVRLVKSHFGDRISPGSVAKLEKDFTPGRLPMAALQGICFDHDDEPETAVAEMIRLSL